MRACHGMQSHAQIAHLKRTVEASCLEPVIRICCFGFAGDLSAVAADNADVLRLTSPNDALLFICLRCKLLMCI